MSESTPVRLATGTHVLADLCDIDPLILRDAARIESILIEAALDAGARVLYAHFHHFGGEGGVTGVVLLAESHITIHTWPEHRFVALDAFMCGSADPERAVASITRELKARVCKVDVSRRGVAMLTSKQPGSR